ncbi:MAG: hypothetical protein A2V77_18100 [Anaeromyxobacter sp. RBG_16_69_14]|nr:MAG: hypothetical protein A2V77_18100 [Anaeromyxobacter sp. RBG_16_69_14]
MQRRLANRRTLQFTLYERKSGAQVIGSLRALDLGDDAMRIEVSARDGDEAVTLDRVADQAAYELIRRRLAESPGNKVQVLSGLEFQSLVEVLREAARLNRRLALGRGALPEFQDLLPKVKKLATDVPEWFQLGYLAASIAESAKDFTTAAELYALARVAAERDRDTPTLTAIQRRLVEVQKQIALLEQPADAAALAPEVKRAMEKIEEYVRTATAYLNELLDQNLSPPPVKLQTDPSLRSSPYWDSTSIVVAPEVQYLPDFAYRQASWPQILAVTGSSVLDARDAPATAIVYSYADVFTMLVRQNKLGQDEKSSDWLLAPGAQELWEGKDLSKVKGERPYLSFKALAAGKVDPSFQASHMRDYLTKSADQRLHYINSGIFNRAFYEAAMRVGSARAAEIWVAALRKLKAMRKIDFPRFARQLYDLSGDEKDKVRQALVEVGLDPVRKLAETR